MATLTSVQAADGYPVFQPKSGEMGIAYGVLAIATNPTAADVWRMCKLPVGAVLLPGSLVAFDIDTNGAPTLDLDVGILAATTTDADTLGNFGVLSGNAVTGYKPLLGTVMPLVFTNATPAVSGELFTLTEDSIVTITVVAAAATFAAGSVSVYVPYTMAVTTHTP